MAVTSVVSAFECPLLELCGPKSTIGTPLELTNRTVALANTICPASAGIPGTLSPSPVTFTMAVLPGVVPLGYPVRNVDENGNEKDLPVAAELRISCVPGWVSISRMIAPDWSWKTVALRVPTWVIERRNCRPTSGAATAPWCRSVSRSGSVELRVPSTQGGRSKGQNNGESGFACFSAPLGEIRRGA